MAGTSHCLAVVCLGLALAAPAFAIDAERDFTGRWILDARASNTRALGTASEAEFTATQQDVVLLVSAPNGGDKPVEWFYSLTGAEARYKIGAEQRNSVAKWEGAALLVNTLVSGPQNYTIMDRWHLSRDRQQLTIIRQIVRRTGQVEGTLIYNRVSLPAPLTAETPVAVDVPQPVVEAPRPALLRATPPPPAAAPEIADLVILAGTRIPLSLRNSVDTKHSHEGDHIYLRTEMPISSGDRIVIPEGSYVNGTLTLSKPAGKVKGKGELFIRFDSLMLPNGVTREFHSRLGSADSTAQGQVDSEGKVTGESDPHKARNVATGGAIGAGVGGIAGSAAGHTLGGLGVGAVAGGIAGVLLSKRPDVVLPRGTTLEMILDRDLHYTTEEIHRPR